MSCGKRIIWTDKMIDFIQKNFYDMTNPQLAKSLGLTLTVTRNKCRELGLKHIELEYWMPEQIKFLKANYKTMGDVDIANTLQILFPKNKKWRKQHIHKKRNYLGLHRTVKEIASIRTVNSSPGGNQYTIDRNSASVKYSDGWIANMIAWRNKRLKKEIIKHPEIIELKRIQLKINREIKNVA